MHKFNEHSFEIYKSKIEYLLVNKYQWITMDISASLKGIFLEGRPLSWKEGKISQLYVNVHVFYIEYFSFH